MTLANGIFAQVLDYLIKEKMVKDQQELAAVTGITETTISRILNDKVRQPSRDTWQKLNEAFGNIFNPQYFRGESTIMLVEDLIQTNAGMVAEESPQPYIPKWADSFFDIMTQQVKQNEELNRQLRQTIEEMKEITKQLTNLLKKNKNL